MKELHQLHALVACWLPGTEAGDGLCDVLFGRRPFTGQLSFSWPRTEQQATLAARSKAGGGKGGPLFPLGFGLRT